MSSKSDKRIKKLKNQRKYLRHRIESIEASRVYSGKGYADEISQLTCNVTHHQKRSEEFKKEASVAIAESHEYLRILGDCLWWACNGLHLTEGQVQQKDVSLQQVLRLCREFAVAETSADSLLRYDDLLVSLSIGEEVEQQIKPEMEGEER